MSVKYRLKSYTNHLLIAAWPHSNEIKEWIKYDVPLADILTWINLNVEPKQASNWYKYKFSLSEAIPWHEIGMTAGEAAMCKELNMTIETVKQWRELGFSAIFTTEWKDSEINVQEADFKSDPKTGKLIFLELNTSPMFARFNQVSEGALCRAMLNILLSM